MVPYEAIKKNENKANMTKMKILYKMNYYSLSAIFFFVIIFLVIVVVLQE